MTATLDGITCPRCGETSRSVIESRRVPDRIRRRCACSGCGERFKTYELRHDQINQHIEQAVAQRTAGLRKRLQRIEKSMSKLRKDLEFKIDESLELTLDDADTDGLTCEQCIHWEGGRCGLGHPDPMDEGVQFARWCASYKGAA